MLVAAAALVVLAVGGGFAVLAFTGGDAPPPPRLEGRPAAGGTGAQAGHWRPVAGSFVGYRVREAYLGVGVRTAVGRTGGVTGTVVVDGERVTSADLRADMTTLRSDQSRRDQTLSYRGIEWSTYPRARFVLAASVALRRAGARASGTLTLHGRRAPIAVTVRGQRVQGGRIELVGSAPIRFADFAIQAPSVAGVVTVRDHGVLEFRLVLARA